MFTQKVFGNRNPSRKHRTSFDNPKSQLSNLNRDSVNNKTLQGDSFLRNFKTGENDETTSESPLNSTNSGNTNVHYSNRINSNISASQFQTVNREIPVIQLSDDTDNSSSDDISFNTSEKSVFPVSGLKTSERETNAQKSIASDNQTLENGQIVFSPLSLIPLSISIQKKYDSRISESFPLMIDTSLEAGSSSLLARISEYNQSINEVELLADESKGISVLVSDEGESIETKADILLGNIKRTRSNIKSIINSRMSLCPHIVMFILAFLKFILLFFKNFVSLF